MDEAASSKGSASPVAGWSGDLGTLTCDVITKILLQLSPQDICSLAACCTELMKYACDEVRIWRQLCDATFGRKTDVDKWLLGQQRRLYREVYPELVKHAAYVGVWHDPTPGSQGEIYSCRWAADGVEVVQLVPTHRYMTQLCHKRLCMLGPKHPRYTAVVLDGDKLVLHDHGNDYETSTAPCAVAEAAASVAAGGLSSRRSSSGSSTSSSGGSDVSEGSSPATSGFCYELLRFMQSSVHKTRSGRRNRRAGSNAPPVVHHLRRVTGPLTAPASKAHPHQLSGLFKGMYGPLGCETIAVSYDVSGSAAQILARKLTGDANVPAGELTWTAAAAALPTPWPAEEQHLVALRPQMVAVIAESAVHLAEIEAEDEAAGSVIAALMQQDDDQQQQLQGGYPQQHQHAASDGAGMLTGGIAGYAMQQARAHIACIDEWAAQMQARRVVAIHKGQGQISDRGFRNPSWVDGRLWVYEDGTCGFVFMVQPHVYHLVDLERLDSDL